MSETQKRQFNRMRHALIRIAKHYATPDQMKSGRCGFSIGLSAEEEIEAAYENIQFEARSAVKGVREMKEDNQ